MPGAAAKLPVGHPVKADLLLHPDQVTDRRILDAAQPLGRDAAGFAIGPRAQQLRRAQQTPDMIRPKR